MRNWRARLRDADPGANADMPAADVERVRNAILVAARSTPSTRGIDWPRSFVVTAAVLLLVCAGMLAGLQSVTAPADETSIGLEHSGAAGPLERASNGDTERQQLQFATPGGTRVIWVFDSQFEVKGSVP